MLSVIDKHTLAVTDLNKIVVEYKQNSMTTTVDCKADLVTIGIAIEVLKNIYDNAIKEVPDDVAGRIKRVVKESTTGEIYRS